ncbi:MAG: AIR synthase-related protein [bacterium]|nr:AIR synthase-related protein [bacterium]
MSVPAWEKSFSYGESGVDIDVEQAGSRILFEASKATWVNRQGRLGQVEALYDDYSGVRFSDIGELPPGTVMAENADGTGTKPKIATIAGRLDTIATDLIEAVCADAVIEGYEPAHITTTLKVNTLGRDEERLASIRELGQSCQGPCARAGVAITNGELTQHPTLGGLDKFYFEWDASLVKFGHESRLIDGSKIQPGDTLIGFREPGFRCNGFSLLIDIFEHYYGENWGEEQFMGQRLADLVLQPSEMYTAALVDITGGYDLNRPALASFNGAAHISGGGIPKKLGRLLSRTGNSAIIDNPISPPETMRLAQALGKVSDKEAYRTWNMGMGMIIVTAEPDKVLEVAGKHGIVGQRVGQIIKSEKPFISLVSRGLEHPGRWTNFFIY